MDADGIANTPSTSKSVECLKKQSFTSSERQLLIELVRERPVIEDKRTHAQNIQLKKRAWEELTMSFNIQPYVHKRTTVQLKRCWENIKSIRKKELCQESKAIKSTGGGPPQGATTAPSDNVIDSICPYIDLKVPEVIDSNSMNVSSECVTTDSDYKTTGLIFEDRNKTLENESIVSPKKFKNKYSACIPTSNKRLESELEARIKRCTLNIKHDEELHEARIQREKILLEREKNTLAYEKQLQHLQIQKLKLEIEMLQNKNI